jgi:hypothetical protein
VVHWREEFILPATPKTWGGNAPGKPLATNDEQSHDLQRHGKVCVTERDVRVHQGVIGNFWSVAQGDPRGKYEMRVSVEGKFVKSFVFEVGRK